MSTPGGVQYTGGIVSKPGHTMMSVGDIMSTVGDVHYKTPWVYHDECGGIMRGVQYTGGYKGACGGYHEYARECSVHQRDTMSTPGDTMSTQGDFGTNEKKPLPNF